MDEKHCDTCKHYGIGIVEEPCCRCDVTDFNSDEPAEFTEWEPKSKSRIIDDPCLGCLHDGKRADEEPCQECGIDGENYFEPILPLPSNEGAEKEDKKMAETRKTKAQLMEELEQKNAEIAELKKELERSANYEQYLDAAKETRSMVDAFVESGFTEEQAITIVTSMIGQATRQRLIR